MTSRERLSDWELIAIRIEQMAATLRNLDPDSPSIPVWVRTAQEALERMKGVEAQDKIAECEALESENRALREALEGLLAFCDAPFADPLLVTSDSMAWAVDVIAKARTALDRASGSRTP